MPDLDSHQAHRLKVRLENSYYEWSYHYELLMTVFRWLLRLLPIAFLPVWLVLYAIVNTAGFISGPPGLVGGTAISAVVALGLAILIVRSLLRDDLTPRGDPTHASVVRFLVHYRSTRRNRRGRRIRPSRLAHGRLVGVGCLRVARLACRRRGHAYLGGNTTGTGWATLQQHYTCVLPGTTA